MEGWTECEGKEREGEVVRGQMERNSTKRAIRMRNRERERERLVDTRQERKGQRDRGGREGEQ